MKNFSSPGLMRPAQKSAKRNLRPRHARLTFPRNDIRTLSVPFLYA